MGSNHASSTAADANVSRATNTDDKKTAGSHVGTADKATGTIITTSEGPGATERGNDEQNDRDVETAEDQ